MPFVKVPPWIQWNLKVARGLACLLLLLEEIVQQLREAKRCKYWNNYCTINCHRISFINSKQKHKQHQLLQDFLHQPWSTSFLLLWYFFFSGRIAKTLFTKMMGKLDPPISWVFLRTASQVFCQTSAPPAASAHLRWTGWTVGKPFMECADKTLLLLVINKMQSNTLFCLAELGLSCSIYFQVLVCIIAGVLINHKKYVNWKWMYCKYRVHLYLLRGK